jgi:hypothetical protein
MKHLVNSPIRLAALSVIALAASIPALAQSGPRGPRNPVALVPATADEIKSLTYMREEEKLARDVYRFLYNRWNYAAFDNIAAAEQQHFAAVGNLLTRYNIPDPAATDTPGVYNDQRLVTLYAELTAKGDLSLKDAFEVGVIIEKQDIADLESAIAQSAKYDIKRVYSNLMNASFNHLEAFEICLEIFGSL